MTDEHHHDYSKPTWGEAGQSGTESDIDEHERYLLGDDYGPLEAKRKAMTELTDDQLSEWERLANEATDEWYLEEKYYRIYGRYSRGVCEATNPSNPQKMFDLNFILASRIAVPALIAEVRRLRALAMGGGK